MFLVGQQTDTIKFKQTNISDNRYNTYIEKMKYYMEQRDFKQALYNVNKAIAIMDDTTENNPSFIDLAIYRAEVYSWFQHLDNAEMSLLNAIGILKEDAEIIVKSTDIANNKDLKKTAKKINNYPSSKTKFGPHIALSLIYNILGDTVNLQKEQQLMAERSVMDDWVISTSMALYKACLKSRCSI